MLDAGVFRSGDVYIDFPYESCMFRWDGKKKQVYVKPYGAAAEKAVSWEADLFRDAQRSGTQVTREAYKQGKPVRTGQ